MTKRTSVLMSAERGRALLSATHGVVDRAAEMVVAQDEIVTVSGDLVDEASEAFDDFASTVLLREARKIMGRLRACAARYTAFQEELSGVLDGLLRIHPELAEAIIREEKRSK